jgi:triacylglycerol lipase
LNCPRLDAPIVLAHGLFGFDRIALGKIILTSYFRGIPEFLRSGGNRVLVTRVPSISGVKSRARALAEQIDLAFPDQPVHVIGHSMGGLDARHLAADPRWSGRVLSLTTIGTPHLGSALADCARLRAGRVYRLLRLMGIEHRGFLDVTRRAARAVNRRGSAPSGVPSFSVAGNPSSDQVCWPLKPFFDLLSELEGPNDGLVSVKSALGFGTPLPSWPVDHLRQTSWLPPHSGPSSARSIRGLYSAVLDNLATLGFASEEPAPPEAVSTPPAGASDSKRRRVFQLDPFLGPLRFGRPVKEHRNGHVAEDVGSRPAAIEKPVDGQ